MTSSSNDSSDSPDSYKSKSQIKREIDELRALVRELTQLPSSKRKQLALPDDVDQALEAASKMTRAALQRQIRFATGLLSDPSSHITVDELQRRLFKLKRPDRQQTQHLHQLESWRDRLLNGDDGVVGELAAAYPDVDRQQVRQLVRNASQEKRQNRAPRAARRLFQLLKTLTAVQEETSSDTSDNASSKIVSNAQVVDDNS